MQYNHQIGAPAFRPQLAPNAWGVRDQSAMSELPQTSNEHTISDSAVPTAKGPRVSDALRLYNERHIGELKFEINTLKSLNNIGTMDLPLTFREGVRSE